VKARVISLCAVAIALLPVLSGVGGFFGFDGFGASQFGFVDGHE
jgi:hypothetical protein